MASEKTTAERNVAARLAHVMPGRLRLRFQSPAEVNAAMDRLQTALAGVSGVLAIESRPSARSIVIRYNPLQMAPDRLLDEAVPAAAIELMAPGSLAPAGAGNDTVVGRAIVKAVGRVNAGVGRVAGGRFDLRDLFPLTLFGFGLRRVAQGQIQPMPWYNLLYYGYSTFAALHGRRGTAEPDAKEILRRRFARGELSQAEFRRMRSELTRGES